MYLPGIIVNLNLDESNTLSITSFIDLLYLFSTNELFKFAMVNKRQIDRQIHREVIPESQEHCKIMDYTKSKISRERIREP